MQQTVIRQVKAKIRGVGEVSVDTLEMGNARDVCQSLIRESLAAGAKLGSLARRADLSVGTLSKLYYGETTYPREETLRKILKVFGWSILAVRGIYQ